mmetsp:Transcript_50692/g.167924  ORF Transcript_50692/g.167924 Transcript_50692/m.167924 type:complete len:202 (+) Transcript_50692:738-1343(+)
MRMCHSRRRCGRCPSCGRGATRSRCGRLASGAVPGAAAAGSRCATSCPTGRRPSCAHLRRPRSRQRCWARAATCSSGRWGATAATSTLRRPTLRRAGSRGTLRSPSRSTTRRRRRRWRWWTCRRSSSSRSSVRPRRCALSGPRPPGGRLGRRRRARSASRASWTQWSSGRSRATRRGSRPRRSTRSASTCPSTRTSPCATR